MSSLPTTNVKIDIEVNRAIEARRATFDQSTNDILRETFNLPRVKIDSREKDGSGSEYAPPIPTRRIVRTRRTGTYSFTLLGKSFQNASLREAYKRCLLELSKRDSGFLDRLAERRTSARRLVARDPRGLFLKSPKLADEFADRLTGPWWFDVNLNQPQVESRLKISCDVAGLQFGDDLRLDFPE